MRRVPINPLIGYLYQTPPPVVFHYTSMGVLEQITDKGEIWASHARFLNDTSEFDHAKMFIRNYLLERANRIGGLEYLIKEHIPVIDDRHNPNDVFVASFSEEGDSLPQWRGYCPMGMGVSVGFDSSALKEGALEVQSQLPEDEDNDDPIINRSFLKCVYTESEKLKLISESVNTYITAIQGKHPQLTTVTAKTFLASTIALCSPLFKHESFKEEREWRLVLECNDRKVPKRHFRVAQSTLIPFIKINVRKNARRTYVKSVYVGPSPNEQLAAWGVKKLLDQRRLSGAMVENSSIPYRSW